MESNVISIDPSCVSTTGGYVTIESTTSDCPNYWPYNYGYRDGIRDWLEGFLDGKSHLTKTDTDRLKQKLGLE